jgi:hypothetical protein
MKSKSDFALSTSNEKNGIWVRVVGHRPLYESSVHEVAMILIIPCSRESELE